MPQPSNGTATPRGDLGIVVNEINEELITGGFIANTMMPERVLPKQAAKYPVIPVEALLSLEDTARAMRGFYNRSDWKYEEGVYATSENGWEEPLDDREVEMYADLFEAEKIAVMRGTGIVLRSQEQRVATLFNTTSNWNGANVTAGWANYAAADPVADVDAARKAIRDACGMLPNTMEIPWEAFENLKKCDKIVSLLRYTFPGEKINNMDASMMAQILNIPQLVIAGAQANTAKKGSVSAEFGELWDPDLATLTITSDSLDMSRPCVGRIIRWDEENGGGEDGTIVEQYREEGSRSDIYRIRHDSDERLIKSYDKAGNVLSDISKAVTYQLRNISAGA